MAFKVRLFPGEPDYETLHVAKLTTFPLESGITSPIPRRASAFLTAGSPSSCSRLRRSRSRRANCGRSSALPGTSPPLPS